MIESTILAPPYAAQRLAPPGTPVAGVQSALPTLHRHVPSFPCCYRATIGIVLPGIFSDSRIGYSCYFPFYPYFLPFFSFIIYLFLTWLRVQHPLSVPGPLLKLRFFWPPREVRRDFLPFLSIITRGSIHNVHLEQVRRRHYMPRFPLKASRRRFCGLCL